MQLMIILFFSNPLTIYLIFLSSTKATNTIFSGDNDKHLCAFQL